MYIYFYNLCLQVEKFFKHFYALLIFGDDKLLSFDAVCFVFDALFQFLVYFVFLSEFSSNYR